jgi:hypothetical protein
MAILNVVMKPSVVTYCNWADFFHEKKTLFLDRFLFCSPGWSHTHSPHPSVSCWDYRRATMPRTRFLLRLILSRCWLLQCRGPAATRPEPEAGAPRYAVLTQIPSPRFDPPDWMRELWRQMSCLELGTENEGPTPSECTWGRRGGS